jgi:large repetitive protein
MSREIMIIAKNKDGVVSNSIVKIGENGQPIVINGTKDTFYEIKDMATNRAPDQIYTQRFKNDLKLKINPKGGALDGTGEADVIIKDYCENGNCEIVGVHETGEYYQYVPQSGDTALMTTKLADGEFAYQSLGTVETASWGPASLLPLAGLGALGGGGGGSKDTTPPTAVPTIDAINDDLAPVTGIVAKGGHTNDTTPTLNGTLTEALGSGEVVAVYRDGVKVGNATVDSSGKSWTFEDTGVTDGEHIYTTRAEDASGNKGTESTPYNIIVDTVAPDAPSVTMVTDDFDAQATLSNGDNNDGTVDIWGADDDRGTWKFDSTKGEWSVSSGNVNVTSDGKIITNDSTPTFSGTGGEAGATVAVYNSTTLLGSAVVDSNGDWSVTIEDINKLADGKYNLFLTQTDTAGNVDGGTTVEVTVDTKLPLYNYEINIADTGIDPRNEGRSSHLADTTDARLGENYYFTNEITFSDDYLKTTGPSTVDNVSYTEGDSIYITFHNKTTGETYLIGGPDGPSVVVDSSGWSIDISSANAWSTTNGYTTLADGEYDADIMIYEPSGNTRTYTASDFAIDTTAPSSNNIEYVGAIGNDSSISGGTVRIGGHIDGYDQLHNFLYGEDGDGVMERDEDYLIGTGPAEIFVSRDGSEIGHVYVGTESLIDNPDADNWSFNETLGDGVYKYEINTMDVAGNSSDSTEAFWVIVDNGGTHSYDLTGVDGIAGKDFEHMVLIGDANNETFTLDSVGFKSIDGGVGTDTFTLANNSGTLNITQTTNFEVYNINNNTLTINGDVDANSDHIIINGTSSAHVNLSSDWSSTSTTQTIGSITYNVYSNNGIDDLWIQNTAVVNI